MALRHGSRRVENWIAFSACSPREKHRVRHWTARQRALGGKNTRGSKRELAASAYRPARAPWREQPARAPAKRRHTAPSLSRTLVCQSPHRRGREDISGGPSKRARPLYRQPPVAGNNFFKWDRNQPHLLRFKRAFLLSFKIRLCATAARSASLVGILPCRPCSLTTPLRADGKQGRVSSDKGDRPGSRNGAACFDAAPTQQPILPSSCWSGAAAAQHPPWPAPMHLEPN